MLVAAVLAAACAAPTEIRLRVHTNVPCTDATQWKGIAIYAGAPGAGLENKAPALTSTACDKDGLVGTLVIVPSGSKDDEVGLRVVGGIAYAPEDCAAHDYQGCIVARREVRFTRHEALDLEVVLTSECLGFGCDTTHTCVAGMCTETQTVSAAPIPVPEAGPAVIDEAKRVVRCGDDGLFCPTTGNVCCLSVDRNAGTTSGECKDPALCSPNSIVLACDDETDCVDEADGGMPGVCSLSYTHPVENSPYLPGIVSLSQCVSYETFALRIGIGLDLCQPRSTACLNGLFPCVMGDGSPNPPLPGYFWCKITN